MPAPDPELSEAALASADLRRGELLSLACAPCHTLRSGEEHGLGPNLYRVFGRRAGTREGFNYSEALRRSNIVWTPSALGAWLANPSDFVVGNNMVFAGYRSAQDRRDLIAYLIEATAQ